MIALLLSALLGTSGTVTFHKISLAPYCEPGPFLDWNDPKSFAGLTFGDKWIYGIPFFLVDPRLNNGRGRVREREVPVNRRATFLFALISVRNENRYAVVKLSGGTELKRPLAGLLPAVQAHPPLYRWHLDLYPVAVHREGKPQTVVSVRFFGADLYALTATASPPESLAPLINRLETVRHQWEEEEKKVKSLEKLASLMKDVGEGAVLPAVPPNSPLSHPIVRLMGKAGLMRNWTALTPDQLVDKEFFNADRFPLTLYLTGEQFYNAVSADGDAVEALITYLRDGGFLVVLPNQPFPFYYDEKGKAVGNASKVGLPVTGGWESPPEGVPLHFEKSPNADAAFQLPDRHPFPQTGDLRWRPMEPPKALLDTFTYQPIWTLKDDKGNSYGEAIAFLEYHKGPLAPGRLLYVWHRLWDEDLMAPLTASVFSFACQEVLKKPPIKKSLILRTAQPVTVDGVLNEPIWTQAPELVLSDIRGRSSPKTVAQLCWDSSYLYIAFACEDDDIWSTKRDRDDFLWEEEVVEAFIDPDGDGLNYFEFQVNPLNTQIDLIIPDSVEGVKDAKKNVMWNCKGFLSAVQVKGTVNKRNDRDEKWTVEMAIPFEGLGIGPEVGKEWRLNLYRIDRPKGSEGDPLLLAWSRCQRWFHEPDRFARVIFAGNPYEEEFRNYRDGSDGSPTWTATAGRWKVVLGQLVGEDSGTDGWIASGIKTGFSWWRDYEVEIRFRVLEFGSDWRDGFWVAFRHQSPSHSYSLNFYGPARRLVQLHKISDGVSTNDENPLAEGSWTGDREDHLLVIRVQGPEIWVALDRRDLIKVRDEGLGGMAPIGSGGVVLSARRWSASQGHTRVAISRFKVSLLK